MSILQGTVMIFLLIGGFLNELIGRKKTMLLGQTCILAGWIVVYFSKIFEVLLLGRFFNAMGIGFTFSSGHRLLESSDFLSEYEPKQAVQYNNNGGYLWPNNGQQTDKA